MKKSRLLRAVILLVSSALIYTRGIASESTPPSPTREKGRSV